jgi:putative flavoprotein involved in K+ transport
MSPKHDTESDTPMESTAEDHADRHPDDHLDDYAEDCLDVVVIGAGQAGLAIAWHLAQQSAQFLVVDSTAEIGHNWRTRWDSLRLFTPAQYDSLPGMAFPARADTYPTKDAVAEYLAEYATRFRLPVRLNCTVTGLERRRDRFVIHTSRGALRARQVVVTTGPFQIPVIPAVADGLPADVAQLHSVEYRNPAQIPAGPVVVVGAGNSGRQIAAELASRYSVTLAVGTTTLQLPQRILGRDLFRWLTRLGVITAAAGSRLAMRMRARGDVVIGTSDKALRRAGVRLQDRVVSTAPEGVGFADGTVVRAGTVIWATGFRNDYSWIRIPGVGVGDGDRQQRGATDVPGLHFLGLPWQHSRGSALLGFVGRDAAWLAERIKSTRDTVITADARAPFGAEPLLARGAKRHP